MISKIIKILFFIVIIAYLFYGIDIKKFDFSLFSISGIILTSLALFAGQIILSFRWMSLSKLSFKASLETIIVSSALNMFLPARMGEASKAFYLKKFYHFNYHKSLAIIFAERFFDIVVLFLIICLWAFFYFTNDSVKTTLLILMFLVLFIIIFFNSKTIYNILKKIPFRFIRIYSQKIYKHINKILKKPQIAFGWSVVLWIFYLLSYILFFHFAINFNLSLKDMVELFIFSTFAIALPISPAGVGTFEGAIVLYLTQVGINKESALMSAALFHVLIFVVDLIMFYIFLLYKDIKIKDLMQK